MDYDVFVSFKSEDQEIAEKICDDLELRDIQCWISSRCIRGGQDHQGAIVKALLDTSVMVLVFTSATEQSDEIMKELTLASKYKKHVIPVRTEDFLPEIHSGYTYELATRQYIDLFKEWEKGIDRLAEDIGYHLSIHKEKGVGEGGEKALPSASQKDNTTNEARYLDLLNMAYADGLVSSSEREFLVREANRLGISPEKANDLEKQIEVVTDEFAPKVADAKRPEDLEEQVSKVSVDAQDLEHEAPKDWPEIGFDFLQKVQTSIEPNLPFDPQARSDNTDIENDSWAWWHCNPKHYFAVSLVGKRTPNVSIEWGFYSEHEKRDPLLRKIATDIQEHSVILDAEEEDEADLEKDHYQFLPDNQLCVIADRRIKISELSNSNLIDDISSEFIDFIKKVWPIISSRYKEEEG